PHLLTQPDEKGLRHPTFSVRNQGNSGRCVGYALANLIDIQRHLQHVNGGDPNGTAPSQTEDITSADMLYRMAHFHDRYPALEAVKADDREGILTLRSAIKGFYHHGACLDWPFPTTPPDATRWQSDCYLRDGPDIGRRFTSVEQARNARDIGLGAYFRLASVLNHFHAALNDAQAVLVSANVHDGWLQAVPNKNGVITWPPSKGKMGTHAFVLTGYDEHGFHVLNSWGPEWGGYKGQAGIGLWNYDDWARNVIDGWVLRLGVPAPAAFGASVGEKGSKGVVGKIRSGSTPCFELVGHYMHLDDGYHVSSGSYPSFSDGWSRTQEHLAPKLDPKADPSDPDKYRGILLWIPGSLEGIKPAFSAAVARKNAIKALGLYPYTIFWCNSFVEKSLEVLESLFDSCMSQAGETAEHLDELIENRVRGVGRAFWRDIEMSAMRALKGTGELPFERHLDRSYSVTGVVGDFLHSLLDLKEETGCELHIVAEGAGALMVHEMLSLLRPDMPPPFSQPGVDFRETWFDTMHLAHPAIGLPRAQNVLLPRIAKMNGPLDGKRRRKTTARKPVVQSLLTAAEKVPARIYVPTEDLEERVCFGGYGKSVLHLVSNAFEDRYPLPRGTDAPDAGAYLKARPFLGMASLADNDAAVSSGAVFRLNRILDQKHDLERIQQSTLNDDQTITNSIFECIKGFQKRVT
ncbi:C1 family peptidase, partial [Gelidibacter sp. F2691]|nr:C1 family peptidase [Gelidibacter sp. F2691]